ncbi:hypothetical protein FGO68_gene17300 [Halteria grandinella]|uniref:Uncharacterized protein n=1 Tax=Halteria grandinella TaxID=5974 RepID=A0A8J8P031_HALGN|nr:hypothetical protein FGO68_gene17300 [Halteria grandinella]
MTGSYSSMNVRYNIFHYILYGDKQSHMLQSIFLTSGQNTLICMKGQICKEWIDTYGSESFHKVTTLPSKQRLINQFQESLDFKQQSPGITLIEARDIDKISLEKILSSLKIANETFLWINQVFENAQLTVSNQGLQDQPPIVLTDIAPTIAAYMNRVPQFNNRGLIDRHLIKSLIKVTPLELSQYYFDAVNQLYLSFQRIAHENFFRDDVIHGNIEAVTKQFSELAIQIENVKGKNSGTELFIKECVKFH